MGRPLNKNYFNIVVTAKLTGVTPAGAVTILKQVSTNRYKVTNGTVTEIVRLVPNAPTVDGTAAITATDSASGTYFVTKLTANKALITAGTGTQFTTGTAVQWTTGPAVLNTSVQIATV